MNATEQRNELRKEVINFIREHLGFEQIYTPNSPSLYSSLQQEECRSALHQLNRSLPAPAIEQALTTLHDLATENDAPLIERNKQLHTAVQEGLYVSYYKDNQERRAYVRLISPRLLKKQSFQFTLSDDQRLIILYVNGLPLVLIALDSYEQIETLKRVQPDLMAYNAFCIICTPESSRAGSLTADEERYMTWKKPGELHLNHFSTHLQSLLEKKRLIEILQHFLCYAGDQKYLAAYHQYHAVHAARRATERAHERDGRAGVFWHTQGSGKSLSMVFYAKQLLLSKKLAAPTLIIVTDRHDLDNQISSQFALSGDFLHTQPIQARSRKDLRRLLSTTQAGGIILTTLQKFDLLADESDHALSQRRNIVVIADEAHRSHYGLIERVESTGQISIGSARKMRLALPHASFIGFTGTPITENDRSTREVFGDYVDIYDISQAIEDGVTCPIHYESRVNQLSLDTETLAQLDRYYQQHQHSPEADPEQDEQKTHPDSSFETLLSSDATLGSLCDDLISHYESQRQDQQTGKALLVAPSRRIAMQLRDALLQRRPDWHSGSEQHPQTGKLALVMSSSASDPSHWQSLIGDETQRGYLEQRFKDKHSPLKIVIVVDMWLTGFDLPSLSTLYMYRAMRGHSLMQAIARVNRAYKGKPYGLIVDYIGIAQALQQAMEDYSLRDRERLLNIQHSTPELKRTRMQLEICHDLLEGCDYEQFSLKDQDSDKRNDAIARGVKHLLRTQQADTQTPRDAFLEESQPLRANSSLCGSQLSEKERHQTSYFLALRAELSHSAESAEKSPPAQEKISPRLSDLLRQSTDAAEKHDICDRHYLRELAKMEHKHLAIQLIERLLREQLDAYHRINCLRAESYLSSLELIMQRTRTGGTPETDIIQQLEHLALDFKKGKEAGLQLELNDEEYAFYDALTKPSHILDHYQPEGIITITRELTQTLSPHRGRDWKQKETIQARMRCDIKRHLARHSYPLEARAEALSSVMRQCEAVLAER